MRYLFYEILKEENQEVKLFELKIMDDLVD